MQVPLCADGPALTTLEDAKAAVTTTEAKVVHAETRHQLAPTQSTKKTLTGAKAARTRAVKAVKAAEATVAEYTMLVSVQPMLPDDYRALKDEHKPTDPAKLEKGDEWDETTFAPALIAESLVEGQPVTPGDVPDMWSTLTLAERAILFLTCYSLNETVPDLGFIEPDTGILPDIGLS